VNHNGLIALNVPSPNNPDVDWLQERSGRKTQGATRCEPAILYLPCSSVVAAPR
jgi:hypothetical protein